MRSFRTRPKLPIEYNNVSESPRSASPVSSVSSYSSHSSIRTPTDEEQLYGFARYNYLGVQKPPIPPKSAAALSFAAVWDSKAQRMNAFSGDGSLNEMDDDGSTNGGYSNASPVFVAENKDASHLRPRVVKASGQRAKSEKRAPPATPDSTLTFAAVWDPEQGGMRTFAGRRLLQDTSSRYYDDNSSNITPFNPNHYSNNNSARTRVRQKHRQIPSFDSGYATDTPPKKTNVNSKKSAPGTPNSTLTFAAVWDPDGGMTTFSGKRLLDHDLLYSEYLRDGLGARPKPRMPSVDSGYATDITEKQKPQRVPSIDDEGFYESIELFGGGDGHPDCEPHLPSRFSTTTTSTSNYINIDFPPPTPLIPLSEFSTPQTPSLPLHQLASLPTPTLAAIAHMSDESQLDDEAPVLEGGNPTISPPFLLLPVPRPANRSQVSLFPALKRSKSSPSTFRAVRPTLAPHLSLDGKRMPVPSGSPSRISNMFGKFKRSGSQDEELQGGWVRLDVKTIVTVTETLV
ncbi:hypothetical protein C8J56DRAFT_540112 [Mycena floridula]|nr:hypothetical protein C8J56DRAFT_540112 [Mycena floridula]